MWLNTLRTHCVKAFMCHINFHLFIRDWLIGKQVRSLQKQPFIILENKQRKNRRYILPANFNLKLQSELNNTNTITTESKVQSRNALTCHRRTKLAKYCYPNEIKKSETNPSSTHTHFYCTTKNLKQDWRRSKTRSKHMKGNKQHNKTAQPKAGKYPMSHFSPLTCWLSVVS